MTTMPTVNSHTSDTSADTSVLFVVAHPQRESLTWAVAEAVRRAVCNGARAECEVIDLVADQFDPVFRSTDMALYASGGAATAADIRAAQTAVERAQTVVFVFPVYWWAMPAVLKGWVDRVFTRDWAYSVDAGGTITGLLTSKRIRIVGLAGGGADMYRKHAYDTSLTTQLSHGIFEFCGAADIELHLLHDSEDVERATRTIDQAAAIGRRIAATSTG
ncbi:NAD(P)H-dependent oxidoreductase [Mycolicibacterium sp.]|uniref:NAD(P)H-dependent oxidoreductase n=1 Tax=Mycolicibacterium sp. TaxID=2320850 RepID=UPI0037C897EA